MMFIFMFEMFHSSWRCNSAIHLW